MGLTDVEPVEIDITLKVKYTIEPFIPGKFHGPPENCYPDEGGDIEWTYDEKDFEEQVLKAIFNYEKTKEPY